MKGERLLRNKGHANAPPESAPLGGTRSEALQRLQIGLSGIGAMVLLVGLASMIGTQADLADEAAVPDAAPTTEPTAAAPQRDPLADAGIVPDMPAEPATTPTPAPPELPSVPLSPAPPVESGGPADVDPPR